MQQAISAGHEITLEVAKEILLAKGNAFDAAIAATFAMFITEPCMASAGGAGFALIRPANGKIQFFDYFCQTPISKKIDPLEFYPVLIDFGGEQEEFHIGLGSVAVPGTIAGLFSIHEKLGTIPMKELVQPAMKLAKDGVLLNEFQAFDLKLLNPIFQQDISVRDIFFKNNQVKEEGDLIQMPGMVDFLEFIGNEGVRGFYEGEISKIITQDCQERGGFLRRADFENYKTNILEPLKINYRDKNIYLPNGPSKGGAMMALMLSKVGKDYPTLALAIEATQNIIQKEGQIKSHLDHVFPNNNFTLQPSQSFNRGTSHFNIIDRWDNAISMTSTIGEGCGYFIPGTNMQLNNMLGEIFLLPNGAHSWEPNLRMNSMMTPTIVTNSEEDLEFVSGTGGANRIPFAIGQVIYHLFEQQKNLLEATEHPRVHFQDGKFQIENGFDWPFEKNNTKFWEGKGLYFGGVHSIQKVKNGLEAVGDDRRFGVAEVF